MDVRRIQYQREIVFLDFLDFQMFFGNFDFIIFFIMYIFEDFFFEIFMYFLEIEDKRMKRKKNVHKVKVEKDQGIKALCDLILKWILKVWFYQ